MITVLLVLIIIRNYIIKTHNLILTIMMIIIEQNIQKKLGNIVLTNALKDFLLTLDKFIIMNILL
jgi:hypothetical protein